MQLYANAVGLCIISGPSVHLKIYEAISLDATDDSNTDDEDLLFLSPGRCTESQVRSMALRNTRNSN